MDGWIDNHEWEMGWINKWMTDGWKDVGRGVNAGIGEMDG